VPSNSDISLDKLIALFCGLFVLGVALTLPLFRFDWARFLRSPLYIKIVFWIPIFLIFLAALYSPNVGRIIILVLLIVGVCVEVATALRKRSYKFLAVSYLLLFVVAFGHFYLLGVQYSDIFMQLLVIICFASVLSDVVAFFCGKYLGRHKLPKSLNNNKSWEGVAGQILGALAGMLLVKAFIIPAAPLLLFLPLGVGSAMGDLVNSFVKRKIGIKDWSRAIPGHGGFLDRLSSLAGSVLLAYYFFQIIQETFGS